MAQNSFLPRRLVVSVTKTHVQKGRRESPTACPIALALREEYGGQFDVDGRVVFRGAVAEGSCDNWSLSDKARDFVDRFDEGLPVKPGRFAFLAV